MIEEPEPRPNGKVTRDIVTWRSIVMTSFCIIGALLVGVLAQINKTAELANNLAAIVNGMNSRLDAHRDRLADHDKAIFRLEDRVFVKPN